MKVRNGVLPAIRRAAPLKKERPAVAQLAPELIKQPRLPHARFGHHIDDADFLPRVRQAALEQLQLALSSDIGAQPPEDRGFEPGGARPNRVEPIDLLRFGLALDVEFAGEHGLGLSFDQAPRRFAQIHGSGLGQLLQPRSQIDRVAERRDRRVLAEYSRHDGKPGVDADAHLRPASVLALEC